MASPPGSDEFLSPVSSYNRARQVAQREQQERMQRIAEDRAQRLAVRLGARSTEDLHNTGASAKRKLSTKKGEEEHSMTVQRVKRSRMSSPARPTTGALSKEVRRATIHAGASRTLRTKARTLDMQSTEETEMEMENQPRYLSYDGEPAVMGTPVRTPTRTPTKTPRRTPTPQSRRQTPSAVSEDRRVDRSSDASLRTTPEPAHRTMGLIEAASQYATPPTARRTSRGSKGAGQSSREVTPTRTPEPRLEDGLVDLTQVKDVSHLEVVEGDDILSALLVQSTPRVGRHFPSEHTHTDSEEKEMKFLRRRRIAASREQVTNDMLRQDEEDDTKIETVDIGKYPRRRVSTEAQQARDEAEDAKARAAEDTSTMTYDDDDDDETTDVKITRLRSTTRRWSWRHFVGWLLGGLVGISVVVALVPLLRSFFQPPLPFCDANANLLEEGPSNAVVVMDQSTFQALQPQLTSLQPYRPECRNCPLYGVCTHGSLVACIPPFELRNGVCVESQDVQRALDFLAKSIEAHVRGQVSAQVCGPPLLPSIWDSPRGFTLNTFQMPDIVIMLSDLQQLVLHSPYAEALKDLTPEYIFNRSLHLALFSLQRIATVVGDARAEMRIRIAANVAPWTCRARNELISHAHWIAVFFVIVTLVGIAYRKYLLYKTERELIMRLVREVRFFLIGRAQRSERFYPAHHLRDNLLDTLPHVSPRDRVWLRETVWPKVSQMVSEDSRVSCRIAPIHGQQMAVWEWISSSPTKQEGLPRRRRNARPRYSI